MRRLTKNEFPVAPCGSLNLRTGKNRFFNVLEDWTPGDSRLTLYYQHAGEFGRYRIVAGWGSEDRLPETIRLVNDQTYRKIGDGSWSKCASFPNTPEGLAALKIRVNNSPTVAMCTLK